MPRRTLLLVVAALAINVTPVLGQATDTKGPANRLAKETSPYLLLHAHNPVDWYPWGPEAFAKAKREDKPIFLSVGYSSCYWCHVMERESFMDPAIAKQLNDGFVCVKVDREERPDVDQVYMTALQVFGRGGWPMSMFLMPDGRPFFGGTYFPPADRDGMDGFPGILRQVTEVWKDNRPRLNREADHLAEVVRRTNDRANVGAPAALDRATAASALPALAETFDPEFGGFGFSAENPRRPKFPEPVNLVYLLDRQRRQPAGAKADPLGMTLTTLDHMARGGVRDQLGGGYHRYATNRDWSVPHFEKMLYDNAQLASVHLAAFELTGDPRWRAEAEATFAFVAGTMTDPDGGFRSSLDAETGGEEGKSYVWTRDEVTRALGTGEDVATFSAVYGLDGPSNFEGGRYVLLEPLPRAKQAERLKLTPEALEAKLAPQRAKLLAARRARPAPAMDDKILTSWNGLMIAAYADGFRVLHDARYKAAAEKAADFLLAKLRARDGRLLRTYRAGVAKLPAYLEDYAFLAHGLIRLHAATGDPKRLAQARTLTDLMIADFTDTRRGGFFYTADDHESLISRTKDPSDNVLPSGNSVAARNLVALAALTKESRYLDLAGQVLDGFAASLARSPASCPLMLVALDEYLDARPAAGKEVPKTKTPAPAAEPVVTARAKGPVFGAVAPGGEFTVSVTLDVKPGWHLYANPTGVEGMSPTRVTLATGQGASLLSVDYPAGVAKVLGATGSEKVFVYEGTVTLKAKVKVEPGTLPGRLSLVFTVHEQACDDRRCLAPEKVTAKVSVDVGL